MRRRAAWIAAGQMSWIGNIEIVLLLQILQTHIIHTCHINTCFISVNSRGWQSSTLFSIQTKYWSAAWQKMYKKILWHIVGIAPLNTIQQFKIRGILPHRTFSFFWMNFSIFRWWCWFGREYSYCILRGHIFEHQHKLTSSAIFSILWWLPNNIAIAYIWTTCLIWNDRFVLFFYRYSLENHYHQTRSVYIWQQCIWIYGNHKTKRRKCNISNLYGDYVFDLSGEATVRY